MGEVGEVGEEVEATVVTEKQIEESSMNIETVSAYVGTMDESVEADAVPDQQNEKSVEAELIN